MNEFGVPSHKQYVDGEAMMFVDGKKYRYKGTIPLSLSPWAVANIGAVFLELTQMCKSIPLEAPWDAPKAQKWDQLSWAAWLDRNTLSKPAHELLESSISGLYTSAASEISLLFVLFQMASAGGPSFVLGVKDAAEDARPVGGMGAIHRAVAAELGDALHLSQPVRSITQYAEGVIVRSDDMVVRARRVVVAVPIAIASQIIYEPMLPVDRSFLHQRMPLGACFKIALVYDEPFWRASPSRQVRRRTSRSTPARTPEVPAFSPSSPRDPSPDRSASSRTTNARRPYSKRSPKGLATKHFHPSTTSSRTGRSNATPAAR
jgi:monoamine oxidase